MPNPTCELITFAHNMGGQRLENSLKTLSAQRCDHDFDVTVIELGSDKRHAEQNAEICRRYGCRHTVVEYRGLWSKPLAFNYGIKRSHAKYIGLFDLDMLFPENTVGLACEQLSKNPMCVLSNRRGGVQFLTSHILNLVQGYDEEMFLWSSLWADMIKRVTEIGGTALWFDDIGIKIGHQQHVSGIQTEIGQKYLQRNIGLIGGPVVKNRSGWGETPGQSISHSNAVPYPELTIVLGTYNRFGEFVQSLETARESIGRLKTEFVVVDGGSRDGSQYWCYGHPDITLIEQKKLVGACLAYNTGFRAARAEYAGHINDDVVVLNDCLERGYDYISQHPDVGQVLFIHSDDGHVWKTGTVWEGRIMYANFGITRKWLGDYVGWWGDYKKYAGDSQLSLRIRLLGYKCTPLEDCLIRHFRTWDELRQQDPVNLDQQPFYNRWGLNDPGIPIPEYPLITKEDVCE